MRVERHRRSRHRVRPDRSDQRAALVLVGLLLSPGCALLDSAGPASAPAALEPLSGDQCRATLSDDGDLDALQRAARQSLEYYSRVPEERPLTLLGRTVHVRDLRGVLESLLAHPPAAGGAAELCDRFTLARAVPSRPMLITGYYEPVIDARRRPDQRFRHPLYGLPDDLVELDLAAFCAGCAAGTGVGRVRNGKLVPYYTRAEIDAGALAGRDAEIAWVDDPVEAFFLQVQGSGLLRFDDGVHAHISYNGSNGRPYTSIGRVLVEAGKMAPEEVSLASLKEYLRDHPQESAALMQRNERYTFFRNVAVGPVGSLGVALTAGRSIAADRRHYPAGALALLKIGAPPQDSPPDTGVAAQARVSRLVLVQDAGAAISGDHRLDVYWGSGETAAAIAGSLRTSGELYFVLPSSPS